MVRFLQGNEVSVSLWQSSGRKEGSWGAEQEEGWGLQGAQHCSVQPLSQAGCKPPAAEEGERGLALETLWQWLEAVSSPDGTSTAHRLSHKPCPEETPEEDWEPARSSSGQTMQEPAPVAVPGAA